MRFVYWITLFIPIHLSCFAQTNIDSLKSLVKAARDENNTVNIPYYLSHIGWEFQNSKQYDSALTFYFQSLSFPIQDAKLIASNMNNIGLLYDRKGLIDSSLLYYNKAIKIYAELGDTVNLGVIERNVAIIYKNLGLYEKALESGFDALTTLEKQRPDRTLASAYTTIADVYLKIGDFQNALDYHRKALTVRKIITYSRGVGQSYHNLGEVFIEMHQYDSALSNLFHSIEIKKAEGDTIAMGTTFIFIGEVYLKLNELKQSEDYLLQSLKIKKTAGERLDQVKALNNLGKVKLLEGNFNHAKEYLNLAGNITKEIGALDELRKNLELKVTLYKSRSDYQKALEYASELLIVKDSLLSKNKLESLLSMEARFETEKMEQQINLLEQDKLLQASEINSKKQWILTLTITITLLAVIGILFFYSYKHSQRSKQKVETLLQELHHRVKNNLQILSSVLSLQSQHLKEESAIQAMKSSESRVNTMALIHKKLYGGKNSRTIVMKEYIQELVQFLVHSYGFTDTNLQFHLHSDEVELDVDKAIPTGLILNEVISNSLKYAYTDQKDPQLTVTLKTKGNILTLTVQDNGPGIKDSTKFESPQSFGLRMVNTLAKELKGNITTPAGNGTTFVLQIPIT